MKKLNEYFFFIEEDEKVHPSDAIWFYGTLAVIAGIGLIVVL